jgi:hypothetical protein
MSVRRSLSRKFRTSKQAKSKCDRAALDQGPAFEPLEPRLFRSADPTYAILSDGIFDLESELPSSGNTSAVLASVSVADEQLVQTMPQDQPAEGTAMYRVPQLPGLELTNPNSIDQIADQIFYLDFDGAENVVYDGPVTVGPFDVPVFSLVGTSLAGYEQLVIDQILSHLQRTFADSGVTFTTEQPAFGTEYSRIYIGGDDTAFSEYGSFLSESLETLEFGGGRFTADHLANDVGIDPLVRGMLHSSRDGIS